MKPFTLIKTLGLGALLLSVCSHSLIAEPTHTGETVKMPAETETAEDGKTAARETTSALRERSTELLMEIPQPWMGSFPDRKLVSEDLQKKCRQLMDDLLFWIESEEAKTYLPEAGGAWCTALKRVFQMRVMLEWQELEPSLKAYQDILHRLEPLKKNRANSKVLAQAAAGIAKPILCNWLNKEPETIQPLIQALEQNWLGGNEKSLPAAWLKDRCDYAQTLYFSTASGSMAAAPAEARSKIANLAAQWIVAYLVNKNIPLEQRNSFASKFVIGLHTQAREDEAQEILNRWKAEAGNFVNDNMTFLHASFFVAQIGHGNRLQARRILDQMDTLVAAGKLSDDDDSYVMVTQNYYRNLTKSDLDHQLMTRNLAARQKKRLADRQ